MLEQMGIAPWFSRVHLPGAAPAHPQTRRALQEAVRSRGEAESVREGSSAGGTPEVAGSIAPDRIDRRVPERTATLQRLLQDGAAAPSVAATQAASSTASKPRPTAEQMPRSAPESPAAPVVSPVAAAETVSFAFCWIDLDEHLAVVAELPPNSRRLSRESRQMLVNITAALNPRYRMATLREHNFHWPFMVTPDLPADAQAAQQAVDGFIRRRLQEHKVSHVLVLSDAMPFYLAVGLSDGPVALRQHAQHGFRLLQTHALHAMLSDPALKRSAWQAMQMLVSALQNTSDGI